MTATGHRKDCGCRACRPRMGARDFTRPCATCSHAPHAPNGGPCLVAGCGCKFYRHDDYVPPQIPS